MVKHTVRPPAVRSERVRGGIGGLVCVAGFQAEAPGAVHAYLVIVDRYQIAEKRTKIN